MWWTSHELVPAIGWTCSDQRHPGWKMARPTASSPSSTSSIRAFSRSLTSSDRSNRFRGSCTGRIVPIPLRGPLLVDPAARTAATELDLVGRELHGRLVEDADDGLRGAGRELPVHPGHVVAPHLDVAHALAVVLGRLGLRAHDRSDALGGDFT